MDNIVTIQRPEIPEGMSAKEQMGMLNEYLNSCKSLYDVLKTQTFQRLYSKYGINETQINLINQMEDSVIDKLTYQNLGEYLKLVEMDISDLQRTRKNNYRGELSLLEYAQEMFRSTKEEMEDVNANKANLDDIMNDIASVKKDFVSYVHSDKFLEKKKEHIDKLKEEMEKSDDEDTKNSLGKKLKFIEKLESYSFLTERLDTLGKKEVERLKTQFFSTNLGGFVMNKFEGACKKFKIAANVHKYFINLEEMFLPEEYYPLNNMFLFTCIGFVNYADHTSTEERAYVDKLFNGLTLLINHQFVSDDEEKRFVSIMEKVDKYFLPYVEEFKEKNITWKEHEMRIRANNMVERRKRDTILKQLKLRGIEESPDKDSEALQKILDEEIKKSLEIKKLKKEAAGRGNTTQIIYEDVSEEKLKEMQAAEDTITEMEELCPKNSDTEEIQYIDMNIEDLGLDNYEIEVVDTEQEEKTIDPIIMVES